MAEAAQPLSFRDHARDSAGMVYVYPVVSRRAGGVSVGINLNPNNACNWRCIYCQVPNLRRGGPPAIDLARLEGELAAILDEIVSGKFMRQRVPAGQRRLVDVAFSGNGEPTSAVEFPEAVDIAVAAMRRRGLLPEVKLRLITNGSLVLKASVQRGLAQIATADGEAWFKVDAANSAAIARINGVRVAMTTVARRLAKCAARCPTWVQTCLFAVDGEPPPEREILMLTDFLAGFAGGICGVHLYGIARQSAQPLGPRLQALPSAYLDAVAARMREAGLTVCVSP